MKIKICGITQNSDVDIINEFTPEYAGFIFAKSRRQLTMEQAQVLCQKVDKRISKVGIFVNAPMEEILLAVRACDLQVVQLHGDEPQASIDTIKAQQDVAVWKAFRIQSSSDLELLQQYTADAFVLDTFVQGEYGGSGQTFDWEIARMAASKHKLFLAGGLTPLNVKQAIEIAHPYGVDVSSGVACGDKKDREKVEQFIRTVKEMHAHA
ncbi:MAG: phosphoribosylanthranilate isomerase [Hyphomonadaceae bacterium]|nr:phosphoribosylanthranilate isomerase [Clostridia bacterium]